MQYSFTKLFLKQQVIKEMEAWENYLHWLSRAFILSMSRNMFSSQWNIYTTCLLQWEVKRNNHLHHGKQLLIAVSVTTRGLRGRPLMIWGGGADSASVNKKFSCRLVGSSCRRLVGLPINVPPSTYIYSWRRASEIYFFLESASQNLFFPGEGPPKFFFLNFLQPHPQIITGHPLNM